MLFSHMFVCSCFISFPFSYSVACWFTSYYANVNINTKQNYSDIWYNILLIAITVLFPVFLLFLTDLHGSYFSVCVEWNAGHEFKAPCPTYYVLINEFFL